MVSLPFVTYGGILADNDRAKNELYQKAVELTKEKKAEFTELFIKRLKASYLEKLTLYTDETIAYKAPLQIKKKIHIIDQKKCTACGVCLEVCPSRFDAVMRLSGEPVPAPVSEEERAITRKSKAQ